MKRNVLIMMLLLIVSSFSMRIFAQENINAVVKKYETSSSIAMDHVIERNPKTKKVEQETVLIKISDATLSNEFIAAINKDKEKAIKISENTEQGKLRQAVYQFESITYTFIFYYLDDKKESDSK